MTHFTALLRGNRNYRRMWTGQVISEIGDHFNTIAVFALALQVTRSGWAVACVMLARAIPTVLIGPFAGVVLDRFDRRQVMIASDVVRAVIAAGFVLALQPGQTWLIYPLSALLAAASPFFSSGRSAILPNVATIEELHTANSLTQTTMWVTTSVGAFMGGESVGRFGYEGAFFLNAMSFLFSAWAILGLSGQPGLFRAKIGRNRQVRPWQEFKEGLRYMQARPLILGIGLIGVGWATGGGAAQILFSLFGEVVFQRGPQGIGTIWGCAGLGLILGAIVAHQLGPRLSFQGYKRTISVCYVIHGITYVIFSQMENFFAALVFIALSRASVAVSSVLNSSQLLRHVSNEYRGRVFATNETLTWSVMMLSMGAAGAASQSISPRPIAAVAGLLSSTTALFWGWANLTGRLPALEPEGEEEAVLQNEHEPGRSSAR